MPKLKVRLFLSEIKIFLMFLGGNLGGWELFKKAHLLFTLLSVKLLCFRIFSVVLASEAVKNGSYANHFFFWKGERKQLKRTVAFFSFDR